MLPAAGEGGADLAELDEVDARRLRQGLLLHALQTAVQAAAAGRRAFRIQAGGRGGEGAGRAAGVGSPEEPNDESRWSEVDCGDSERGVSVPALSPSLGPALAAGWRWLAGCGGGGGCCGVGCGGGGGGGCDGGPVPAASPQSCWSRPAEEAHANTDTSVRLVSKQADTRMYACSRSQNRKVVSVTPRTGHKQTHACSRSQNRKVVSVTPRTGHKQTHARSRSQNRKEVSVTTRAGHKQTHACYHVAGHRTGRWCL